MSSCALSTQVSTFSRYRLRALTRRAADRGFMTTDTGAVLVYLSEIVLALTVATVFYYLFERPAVHLSHRIKFRPAARVVAAP